MKLLIFAVALAVISGANSSSYSLLRYEEGQRFFLFPDGEGKMHFVDVEKEETERKFDPITDVIFNLYTRTNPTIPNILVPGNSGSIGTSTFDKTKPVKIVIHGWNSDLDSRINTLTTEAFLKNMDVNVICVDWEKGANVLYGSAVKNVPLAAKQVAALIDYLVEKGTPLTNFHLMGHSLGAHMAGIAARSVTAGKFPFVTAFDPAAPSWGSKSDRVTLDDADYVEVIHTNTASLGLTENLGHNDFYPNGGTGQPGCTLNMACSHSRSYEFFADSIDHKGFLAKECLTLKEAQKGKCTGVSELHMGGASPKPAVGIFYLETNKKVPYYQSEIY